MRILYYTAEGFGFVPFLFHGKTAQVHVSADMFTIEVLADLFLRLDNEKNPTNQLVHIPVTKRLFFPWQFLSNLCFHYNFKRKSKSKS